MPEGGTCLLQKKPAYRKIESWFRLNRFMGFSKRAIFTPPIARNQGWLPYFPKDNEKCLR